MITEKLSVYNQTHDNRFLTVLAASKRARQLLDRAEKHGMSADTEKVILQSLEEVLNGRVTFEMPEPASSKKKSKD